LDFFLFLKVRFSERKNGTQNRVTTSSQQKPMFLLKAQEISQNLSSEQTEKLPNDFAKNLDHYLYGAPKVEE
ncbi:MAG: hypothetical protein ACPGVO_22710, partial [Spirulinaceae cyanobacterium]